MKSGLILAASASAGYVKFERAGYDWGQANAACKEQGMELVTFDDAAEWNLVQQWLGETTDAFWVGYRDDDGTVVSTTGQTGLYTLFKEGEPNNKMGNEACIRMRFGTLNDALCEIYWAGPKKQNIGMGYICENDEPFSLEPINPAEKAELGPVEIGLAQPLETADIGNDAEFFPAHILSNVYRSNKKPDAKFTTGVFDLTELREHGRPVYHNKETNSWLSYSYNPMEQREEDGKWKYSNQQQVGPSIAGHAYIESQAENPADIDAESKCFYFKTYGPKKNRRFRKINCPMDPELIGIDNADNVIGIEFQKIPKSRAQMLNGLYEPIDPPTATITGPLYKKIGNEMYAIQRNGHWEFVEPRGLHSNSYFVHIDGEGDLGTTTTGGKGKKSVDVKFYTL